MAISCGGESARPPTTPVTPTPPLPQLIEVRIEGNTSLTAIGQTSQLTARAMFSDGTSRDVTAQAVWASNDTSVTVSATGLLTVVRFGVATITARYLSVSGNISVRPSAPGTFVLAGWVREPGQGGLAGVTVTDSASRMSAQTNSGGNYVLVGLPSPDAHLRIEKNDYEPDDITATQMYADGALQRIIRLRAGEMVSPPRLAPNDFAYTFGGGACHTCRLVRLVAATAGTIHLRVTWTEPKVTLSLWANGRVFNGSATGLDADIDVTAGESIVYVGLTPGVANAGYHVPFTIEASGT